jgi:hypothetical protein
MHGAKNIKLYLYVLPIGGGIAVLSAVEIPRFFL